MRSTSLSVWFATILLTYCAPQPGIMTWPEYSRLKPSWPYVISIRAGHGELFYFGAAHTYDPSHPQLTRIEAEWARFKPDLALTEGGFPPIEGSRDEAIRKAGEPGLVRYLASRDDTPTTTLDPSRALEVAALLTKFSREQVKLFFVLRSVGQYVQRSGVAGAEQEADRVMRIYGETPGLGAAPRTITELEDSYTKHFPDAGRFTEVPMQWFDPVGSRTFLNEISRASSDYRDEYIVLLLERQVRSGLRVFAVMGGSHVVMQEKALRARLARRD